MDIRQLKYFVQIVESGSLSKASRQLFIAQPALSQQMSRLEDEVGKPLLLRSVRGVLPTENGHGLYQHAKFILRQIDEAMNIARRDHYNVSGRVTIGLPPTTVCALGLPLLRHLQSEYPGIVLNVIEGHSGHLEHMARIGQLDMAILFNPNAAAEMRVEPLLEEELFVIVSKDSRLVAPGRTDILLHELPTLPLIMPSPGHGLRRRIELELERASLTVTPIAEIDSLPLLMHCVADDIAATIKPYAAAYALANTPERWRCLSISDARMTRPNFLYTLPAQKMSPGTSVVRHELRRVVHRLIENNAWEGIEMLPEPTGTDEHNEAQATPAGA